MSILIEHLNKRFGQTVVCDDISLEIPSGSLVALLGPSGSGKTSLLRIIAGLEVPDSGRVLFHGEDTTHADPQARGVGFVFQSFQLLPAMTALENVMLPLELAAHPEAHRIARELLARVGLAERAGHYPRTLSGGEQQRVALARAFASSPRLLFADEPTGSLDHATGERVIDLLFEMNRDFGATLILVTHDPRLAARCGRRLEIERGRLKAD